MGAGILPITYFKGNMYILLGKEVEEKKWSDFGGGREKNETVIENAIREGCEELNGIFGCEKKLFKKVKQNYINTIIYKTYHSILFYVEYDMNISDYFKNIHTFIEKKLPNKINKKGLFEKSEIKWFSKEELMNVRHIRPFYKNIINIFIRNYDIYKNQLKQFKRLK